MRRDSLAWDPLMLAAKMGAIAPGANYVLASVIGLMRVSDSPMEPRMRDGVHILFRRLDRGLSPRDVLVFSHGALSCGRVVALAIDAADIDSRDLAVNGSPQQETGITDDATRVAGGVTFPLAVPEGCVFVLGDNRDEAHDSRIVGRIARDLSPGTVVGLFRRHSL